MAAIRTGGSHVETGPFPCVDAIHGGDYRGTLNFVNVVFAVCECVACQIAAMSLKQNRQPMLAVIYDGLARAEWEDMAAKCPQSFDLETVMARQDPDLLLRAQGDFDVLFKVRLFFHSLHVACCSCSIVHRARSMLRWAHRVTKPTVTQIAGGT